MLCFVDRGVLLGGGESVILWYKFFCCFANSQLIVVCMHVCEHTTSHHFNVKIALISVALVPCILAAMPSNNI